MSQLQQETTKHATCHDVFAISRSYQTHFLWDVVKSPFMEISNTISTVG